MKKVTPALALAAGCLAAAQLSACGSGSNGATGAKEGEPADVSAIKGTSLNEVKLSAQAARRVGIRTAALGGDRVGKTIPYSAVLYDADGRTFAYTSPRPLVFVRAPIHVTDIRGDHALLSSGPPVGTAVVTVGASELYGTEFGVEE
ncbi:MAG: hypothetical protein ACJ77Z_12315 [Thermoleophilaceae bacterium]|jgi:hypothetical protein